MKKIIASTVGLLIAGGMVATNASAVENLFGGYWRTRAFVQDNFDGLDSSSYDRIDNRTRLYYTAKFSDDFKFVNKFEFNSNWGDDDGGDIGADGNTWRVKNSYADFNLGPVNAKVGIMGAVIARGFIFDDDFSAVMLTPGMGSVKVPMFYSRVDDDKFSDIPTPNTDRDLLGIMPVININDNVVVNPYFVYLTGTTEDVLLTSSISLTDGTEVWGPIATNTYYSDTYDVDVWYLGSDFDIKLDPVSLWASLIYNGGTIGDYDVSAFLLAGGVDAGIVHGAIIYASGDDNDADTDINGFVSAPGQSYYWSEIMGLGIFDNRASAGAPGNAISNCFVATAGVTVKPVDKLTLNFDAYWAAANENAALGTSTFDSENELGLELDLKATYALMDNLNLDVVFAYLLSGDATGPEDVMEGGARLSLSF